MFPNEKLFFHQGILWQGILALLGESGSIAIRVITVQGAPRPHVITDERGNRFNTYKRGMWCFSTAPGVSARWIMWGLQSSALTQIHRKSLCQRPSVISALGAENGVHPVNEEGITHISHPLSCSAGLYLQYCFHKVVG